MIEQVKERAQAWLADVYDNETKTQVQALLNANSQELIDSFYIDLEFGTGGLRGIMGVGTNRMNKYTVGAATQGLANYIQLMGGPNKAVAIAYDCRHNSNAFSELAADILSANGIKVYLFNELRPTPLLSFAVRELGCTAGIVITASHNPPEYNGYKVYWSDGGQLVPPHDKGVIQEVRKVQVEAIQFNRNADLVEYLDDTIEQKYYDAAYSNSVYSGGRDLKIVFTSIHGTSITMAPQLLAKFGFTNVHIVQEQADPNGDFPTVKSPNPEESEALSMAIEQAKASDSDIVLGTDPDSDRVGIAVKTATGDWQLMNGNQVASLLVDYMIKRLKANNALDAEKQLVVKTIVTTELIREICNQHEIECIDTLTGFKYIAEQIRLFEGKKKFIAGGEESYGYLVGDTVRDKDAIVSVAMICEMAAYYKDQGLTLDQALLQLYNNYSCYRESLISITKKGQQGAEEIAALMEQFRTNTPEEINGSAVVWMKDFKEGISKNLTTGASEKIDLPSSNVIQLFLADGSKITARPSGTEPKIKYYFSVRSDDASEASIQQLDNQLKDLERALMAL